jgi:uncharacterized protein (DUF1778 family)
MSKFREPRTLSAAFSSSKHVRLIRAAARSVGKTPSAFMRDAAIEAAAKIDGKCPSCGQELGTR